MPQQNPNFKIAVAEFEFDASGWYIAGSSSYYFDHNANTGIDMEQAELSCQGLGARLATFEDYRELQRIRNYVLYMDLENNATLQDTYLVGT